MKFAASPPSKELITGMTHLRALAGTDTPVTVAHVGVVRRRRRLRVAAGGFVAVSILFAGCASPGEAGTVMARQAESLNTIEINDQLVALPTTRLVLCKRPPAATPLFFWTGSNVLTPRRPLSDEESDRVEVGFDDTTLTLKSLTLQVHHRGKQISAQWPDEAGLAGFASLTSPGPHRYVAAADVPASGVGGRLSLLIEFRC